MKSFEPYLALERVGSSVSFELSAMTQIPSGHQKIRTDVFVETTGTDELADVIEYHLEPSIGAPAFTIDETFTMPRSQNQSLVIVRTILDENTRPNPKGTSAAHYADPD
jgi:hypothetical protein